MRFRLMPVGSLVVMLGLCLPGMNRGDFSAAYAGEAAVNGGQADTGLAPDADGQKVVQENALMWMIRTSGWIGGVLLLMSLYFVAKVIQLFVELRPDQVSPAALLQEWEALLQKRDYQGIYRSAKQHDSPLAQLVAAGLVALPNGLSEARESVDRLLEAITVGMERRISMLAVIGTLGPMIGLLGTLKGMIGAFSVIAMSDTQLKASEVAGNLSEALLITFEGVGVSVPAIYFYAVFRNRVSTLSVDAMAIADSFLQRVNASIQGKRTAATAPAPAEPA